MIKVVRYRDEKDSIIVNYTARTKIRHIVNAINDSEKQPLVFTANCKVHVIYADSTITVLCNGASIKYKGITFKMSDSIEDILN